MTPQYFTDTSVVPHPTPNSRGLGGSVTPTVCIMKKQRDQV